MNFIAPGFGELFWKIFQVEEQKQSHLEGTLQDSGYWEEGEKFREQGFQEGEEKEGSARTPALSTSLYAVLLKVLTEAERRFLQQPWGGQMEAEGRR